MSDFTPDEMMTLRVATRSYMESMRTNAITFTDDPDTGHYFASEAERAEELWNKLVRMDLESIHAAREALAEAVMKDDPDYREDSDSDELKADRDASDSMPHVSDTYQVLHVSLKRQSARTTEQDEFYRTHRYQDPRERGGRP